MTLPYLPEDKELADLFLEIDRRLSNTEGKIGSGLSHKDLKDIEDHKGFIRQDGSVPVTGTLDFSKSGEIKNSRNRVLNVNIYEGIVRLNENINQFTIVESEINHALLKNILWSVAGHTIDTNFTIGIGTAATDYSLIFDGDTNDGILTWMEALDYFNFKDSVVFDLNIVIAPSALNDIGAAGAIPSTSCFTKIQGDGGAVTAGSIAAGIYGQLMLIEGEDDANTVRLDETVSGLHLHGATTMGRKDIVLLVYDADDAEWVEVTRNHPESEKSWAFASPQGASGTFYYGGYYAFGATDNDFNPVINWGTANGAYGAHFFVVQAAGGAGGTDTVIRITGTSINDSATRTAADTEDITIDDAGAAGTYYETSKKWIGLVTVVKVSGPDLLCNYGWCKYWDNNNNNYLVTGFEATWFAGATDAGTDILVRHHKVTGWTYNAGSSPTPPSPIADMQTDYNTEYSTVNNEAGAYKRADLNTSVAGTNGEGTIIEVVTTANKTFEQGTLMLRVASD